MCGIAGGLIKSFSPQKLQFIQNILIAQSNRGPDNRSLLELEVKDFTVILGHNRLKILDVSEHANQPMCDTLKRFYITFNGEIYNYKEIRNHLIQQGFRFVTSSDTEVIIYAYAFWGIECVNKFNGAFALAIFDKKTERLILLRDRFGKKPLFYIWQDKDFYFASDASILAKQLKLKPNFLYLTRGLKYGVYEDNTSISPYEDLKALEASHYLVIDLSAKYPSDNTSVKYYDLLTSVKEYEQKYSLLNYAQLTERIEETFNDAIDIRLQADVPVGLSLSGGLDSSSIAALSSKKSSNLIGFIFGSPYAKLSEGGLAAKLISQVGTIKPEYIWPSSAEIVEAIDATLNAQGAPFGGLSIVAQYLLYKRANELGVKVLLGGQGGDEIFAGYRKYQLFYLQQLLQQRSYMQFLRFMGNTAHNIFAEFRNLKLYKAQYNRYKKDFNYTSILDFSFDNKIFMGLPPENDFIRRQTQDIQIFSLPTLLRFEDRNSMGNSVESRLPFLDYRLVEQGLALPILMKIYKGYGKWVLRKLTKDKIPNNIRMARYKRGFDIAASDIFIKDIGRSLRNKLLERHDHIKEYLKPHIPLETYFSDSNFVGNNKKMAEAITLLWLSNNL